jgi:hypothetical protein
MHILQIIFNFLSIIVFILCNLNVFIFCNLYITFNSLIVRFRPLPIAVVISYTHNNQIP